LRAVNQICALGAGAGTEYLGPFTTITSVTVGTIPEPSTIALFGFGLLGCAGMRVLRSKPAATLI
jgi:hypothetical protein